MICDDCTKEEAVENELCWKEGTLTICKYYMPLEGEGETKTILKTRVRRACDLCNKPATYRISFMLKNFRSNPASSGYHRDDCTWCSDEDRYSCDEHKKKVEQTYTFKLDAGYQWGGTWSLARSPHMGLYWKEEELDIPSLITGKNAIWFEKKLGVKLGKETK